MMQILCIFGLLLLTNLIGKSHSESEVIYSECDDKYISCFCGQDVWNIISVPVIQCLQHYHYKAYCAPCLPVDDVDEFCLPYEQCETCVSGVAGCETCPPGKHGHWCDNECACVNGGVCNAENACECPQEFEGDNCQLPKTNYCQSLENPPESGLMITGGTSEGSVVAFSCEDGFALVGSSTATCLSSGEWSAALPSCYAVCPLPAYTPHSHRVFNPTVGEQVDTAGRQLISEIGYTCGAGRQLVGEQMIRCESDGQWSSNPPVCALSCGHPGRPEHGNILLDDVHLFVVGSRVEYVCEQSYKLEGAAQSVCQQDGRWSTQLPNCVAKVSCPHPGTPRHGQLVLGHGQTVYQHGFSVGYKCDDGYTLHGVVTRTCLANEEWSGVLPICVKVSGVNVTCQTQGQQVYAELHEPVKILCPKQCSVGNPVFGSIIYTKESSVCTAGIHAGKLNRMAGGDLYIAYNGLYSTFIASLLNGVQSIASFWPQKSFRFDDVSIHIAEGQTDIATCEEPDAVQNGFMVRTLTAAALQSADRVYQEGSSVTYACSQLFRLEGAENIVCEPSGRWSAVSPRCVRVPTCEEPVIPRHADVEMRMPSGQNSALPSAGEDLPLPRGHYKVNTRAVYTCVSRYYEIVGPHSRVCRSTGQWSASPPTCQPVCGKSSSPKKPYIIHGNVTEAGQWPWQVAIAQYKPHKQPPWFITCGAALVGERFVITAAHCITKTGTADPLDLSEVKLYLGKFYRDYSLDDQFVVTRSISEIHVYPHFEPLQYEGDLAILKMQDVVELNSRVRPICLPDPNSRLTDAHLTEGNTGVVTGFGLNEFGNYSVALEQADIPVVSSERCEQEYRNASLDLPITHYMYCAGYEDSISDACSGDSGGPMVFSEGSGDGRYYVLEGVVSWGSPEGCAQPRQYGGYSRVQMFMPWLNQYLTT